MSTPFNVYRVESGTMRRIVRATSLRDAIRRARRARHWRALGVLTRVQPRLNSRDWGPWFYVQTAHRISESR